MPKLNPDPTTCNNQEGAPRRWLVYDYVHIAHSFDHAELAYTGHKSELRSHAWLLALVNENGTVSFNSMVFIHSGIRGEQGYMTAQPQHGCCQLNCNNGELLWCEFNWAGAGFPLRKLHFVELTKQTCGAHTMLGQSMQRGQKVPWAFLTRQKKYEKNMDWWTDFVAACPLLPSSALRTLHQDSDWTLVQASRLEGLALSELESESSASRAQE